MVPGNQVRLRFDPPRRNQGPALCDGYNGGLGFGYRAEVKVGVIGVGVSS